MASEKPTAILRSKTDMTDEAIAVLSDGEAWRLIYTLNPPKNPRIKVDQICFTGFSVSDKARLVELAATRGLHVVTQVTVSLAFLVTGPNAGPAKLKKAQDQDAVLMTEQQFTLFLSSGELPN